MAIIEIIKMIVWIIANIPSLIQIVKAILELIHALKGPEKKAALQDLKSAYQAAKAGDPEPLKELHDKLASQYGPTDLKKD